MADGKADSKVPKEVKTFVSKHLGKNWKSVGLHLLEDPKDEHFEVECLLDDIDKPDMSLYEKNYQMLRKWQERKGEDATPQALVQALKADKRNDIACKVEKMMACSNKDSCCNPEASSSAAGEAGVPCASKTKLSPTDLATLNFERKRLVSRNIGIQWRELAELLGFSTGQCSNFRSQGIGEEEHCRRMLEEWFKQEASTYDLLADKLHFMGEETLATQLRELNLRA